jgi:8-amino-7-oxononanoate synthase
MNKRNVTNKYQKELNIISKSNRYRARNINQNALKDFASNDYLGLADKFKLQKKAFKKIENLNYYSPKASMLVNGYSPIHKEFEDRLALLNGFEEAVIVGSGFLANISMIESMVRKNDILLIDEEYHASGILASKLCSGEVIRFNHNDYKDLETKLQNIDIKKESRVIVAVEGIYSMGGDLLHKEFFELCEKYDFLMIVDEAHSSGVIGQNLLGIFDFYDIQPSPNHIKMGTLGKAYGSYGAYILASHHIIEFLINRAKPIIYSTAPSIYDSALGLVSLEYIVKNRLKLRKKILIRQAIIKDIFDIDIDGLIVKIPLKSNQQALDIKKVCDEKGYDVGAIRPPTVKSPIIRIIARLGSSKDDLRKLSQIIKGYL